MARTPVLGGASLNPFGGAGVDFGAFDVASNDREAALILTRVEVGWEAGTVTDAAYLAALEVYANAQIPNTTSRLNAEARVKSMRYRIERNVIAAQVDDGSRPIGDLLAYDQSKLSGLNPDSEEYRQRVNVLQSTQQRAFSEAEQDVVQSYNDGQMTTAQLDAWYASTAASPDYAGNADLSEHVQDRRHDLTNRLIEERDQKVIGDYQDGKISPTTFLAYAQNARSRYVPDSAEYKQWDERLTKGRDDAAETAVLYRYDLSQQYAQLQKFISSNAKAPTGSTGSAPRATYSTRTILGADGKWKTVKVQTGTTKGSAGSGPSASEVAAWKQRQIEVQDAKVQLAQIAKKLATVGGAVSTKTVINYYTKKLGQVANGSAEWYAIQGRLDSLNENLHSEAVLAKQGIKISYPKSPAAGGGGGSSTSSSGATGSGGGGGSTPAIAPAAKPKAKNEAGAIDTFLAALANVESGGRYTARNKSSGAFGKYQVMPANWSGWAAKYLGNPNAPQTPENQEKLVKAKVADLYKWLGDWNAVAHWWLTGGGDKTAHTTPGSWSSSSTRYVNNVMAGMGKGPVSQSTLAQTAPKGQAGSGSTAPKGTAPRVSSSKTTAAKPVLAVTGYQGDYHTARTATTKAVALPSNDSEGFAKFYAQYASAFKSGETEFTINGVSYWVGDDPKERTELMLDLDRLRVGMYDEKARAYAGKPAGVTASNQADKAREDAAGNALRALDTVSGPRSAFEIEHDSDSRDAAGVRSTPVGGWINPTAIGLEEIDRATKGIADHVSRFQSAYRNGDLSTAYAEYQMAATLAARSQTTIEQMDVLGRMGTASIEKGFGVGRTEALGADNATMFDKDQSTVANGIAALNEALDVGAEDLAEFQKIVEKDSKGNIRYVDGEVFLDEKNYRYVLGPNGQVKPEPIKKTAYDDNGTPTIGKDDGMVRTQLNVPGGKPVVAWAKYNVGQVGTFTDKAGNKIPIMGKTIQYVAADGTQQLWVEDPFKPGTWSYQPITYKTGGTLKAIPGPAGSTVFQFQGGDGFTYTLSPDKATGTYVAQRVKKGGIAGGDIVEDLGSLGPMNPTTDQFLADGSTRYGYGTLDNAWGTRLGAPALGFTKQEWIDWASNKPVSTPQQPIDRTRFDLAHHPGAQSALGPGGRGKLEDDLAMTKTLPPGRNTVGEPDWYARQVENNRAKTTGTELNAGKAADDLIRKPVVVKPLAPKSLKTPMADDYETSRGTAKPKPKTPVIDPKQTTAPVKPRTSTARKRTAVKALPVKPKTTAKVNNYTTAL